MNYLKIKYICFICLIGVLSNCQSQTGIGEHTNSEQALFKAPGNVAFNANTTELPTYTITTLVDMQGVTEVGVEGPLEEIEFDASWAQSSGANGTVYLSTASEPVSSDPMYYNSKQRVYSNMPGSVSYFGGSTMSYTINGVQSSFSLSADERSALTIMQQAMADAQSGSGSGPGPVQTKANNSSETFDKTNLKKQFEDLGYEVKKKGKLYELSKEMSISADADPIIIYSIYDSETAEMIPAGHNLFAGKNGKHTFKKKDKFFEKQLKFDRHKSQKNSQKVEITIKKKN